MKKDLKIARPFKKKLVFSLVCCPYGSPRSRKYQLRFSENSPALDCGNRGCSANVFKKFRDGLACITCGKFYPFFGKC